MAPELGVITIAGLVADSLGFASQWVTVPASHPGRNFDVEKRFLSAPSTEYRSVQPARIVCDLNHDQPLGELRYLERTDRHLYAVCEIDGSTLGEGPWYFSPDIRHHGGRDIELRALALCKSPAQIGLTPVTAFPWTLERAPGQIVYQHGFAGQLVKRAAAYNDRRRFRSDEPIVIRNPEQEKQQEQENERRRRDYQSLPPLSSLSPEQQQLIPPQARPGWRPDSGAVEWSQHRGRVISVR